MAKSTEPKWRQIKSKEFAAAQAISELIKELHCKAGIPSAQSPTLGAICDQIAFHMGTAKPEAWADHQAELERKQKDWEAFVASGGIEAIEGL